MKLPELALPLGDVEFGYSPGEGWWMLFRANKPEQFDGSNELFTAAQMREFAREYGEAVREACAKAVEALRDDHCAATRESSDKTDWCRPQGDDGCEFVAAWNDAAAAIRRRE